MNNAAKLVGLYVGKPENRWAGKPPTAIAKRRTEAPLTLVEDGFTLDEQADKKVHGGAEKAVHHYPADHYEFWQAQNFETPFVFSPGAFGENVSTNGLTEANVCIGDIFALGTAKVQISQGRQPCWKLNMHTGFNKMALELQKSGRTGWYYRVLEPGTVAIGDRLELLDRLHPEWSLAEVITARFDKHLSSHRAAALASIDAMAEGWRAYFAKKAGGNFIEEQSARLNGPTTEGG